MKGNLICSLIILLAFTGTSFARILTKESTLPDLKSETTKPERNLLVLDHYENRRKEYEAAKCKSIYATK